MEKVKRFFGALKNNIHLIVYAAFLLIQAVNHSFLTIFGDDYYYANYIPRGLGYFVSETVFHYKYTNGRFFVHFLDELLLGFNINLWRIFNIATIAVIVLFVAKITAKTYKFGYRTANFRIALVCSTVLFSLINSTVVPNCVYWATGAMNYLFPLALVLVFYYYYKKDIEKSAGYKWLPILAFFASFTTEQSSAATFAITVFVIFTFFVLYRQKPKKIYYLNFVASSIGLCTVLLAPGNTVRKTYYPEFYEKSLFEKIFFRMDEFLAQMFGHEGLGLSLILLAIFTVLLLVLLSTKKKFSAGKRIIFALLAAASAVSLMLYARYSYRIFESSKKIKLAILFIALPLLVYFIYSVWAYFKKKDEDSALFFLLVFALQAVMLVSPEFGWRTLLCSMILMFVQIVNGVIYLYGELKNAFEIKPIAFVTGVFCAAITALSLLYLVNIGVGYAENVPVNKYNERQIEKFHENPTDTIILAYPRNNKYRYTLPYDNPYHMEQYKALNNIPNDVTILYEDVKTLS